MITLQNISKTFIDGGKEVQAVKDVNLTIHDGDIFGIIGFSGFAISSRKNIHSATVISPNM